MGFVVHQFDIGPMQNFGYLIADEKSREAIAVDPAWSAKRIFNEVEAGGFRLAGLLVTHAHYDHSNAIEEILNLVDLPVYAHREEIGYSRSGNTIVGELTGAVRAVEGDQQIMLGETAVRFLHTPGHTPGSQCVLVGDRLITGDTLFIGGCGRSDLPGGDPSLLFGSLRKIAGLPQNLTVLPGHDYGDARQRTLNEELRMNPYLRVTSQEEFLRAVT